MKTFSNWILIKNRFQGSPLPLFRLEHMLACANRVHSSFILIALVKSSASDGGRINYHHQFIHKTERKVDSMRKIVSQTFQLAAHPD